MSERCAGAKRGDVDCQLAQQRLVIADLRRQLAEMREALREVIAEAGLVATDAGGAIWLRPDIYKLAGLSREDAPSTTEEAKP